MRTDPPKRRKLRWIRTIACSDKEWYVIRSRVDGTHEKWFGPYSPREAAWKVDQLKAKYRTPTPARAEPKGDWSPHRRLARRRARR